MHLHIKTITITLFAFVLLLAITNTWHTGFGWWDQQRLYELVLLAAASLFAVAATLMVLPRRTFFLLSLLLGLGLLSAGFAAYPWYAIKEWGLYLGLLLFTLLLAQQVKQETLQYVLLFGLAIVAFFNAYQFLVYYAMAFATGIYMLDANLLFTGFSNPRFLNQFQGLLIPLVGFLSLHCWRSNKRYARTAAVVLFGVLAVQWCIALTLGGRSLWVGLGLAHLMLIVFFRQHWRLILVQVLAAIVGALLFYALFYLIPDALGLTSKFRSVLRTSSSGRVALWLKSLAVYWQSPWLGVGPMHLAAEWHLRLASPHQALLQLLAEWGPAAMLIAVYLAATGMVKALWHVRSKSAQPIDAALWLAIGTALVMAQFEGVFNAPYTQMWLAIIIAIGLARWLPSNTTTGRQATYQTYTWRVLALVSFAITATVLATDVPTLPQQSEAHMQKHGTGWVPRYWQQGWIPMNP